VVLFEKKHPPVHENSTHAPNTISGFICSTKQLKSGTSLVLSFQNIPSVWSNGGSKVETSGILNNKHLDVTV